MTQGIVVNLTDLIALQSAVKPQVQGVKAHTRFIGKNSARSRGRGMDFTDIRHYQPGDDIRHMEWRITARTGRPHIKLYSEERERPVMILTDFSASMYFGTRCAFKSYIAARLAALLAWTAIKQGDKVGGLVFSADACHEFLPKLRHKGITPFLAALAEMTFKHTSPFLEHQTQPLSNALSRLNHLIKPGCLLILISDLYQLDESSQQQLTHIRSRHDVITFHICDPIELAPPPQGLYPISDGKQTRWLDIRNQKTQALYQTYCEQRINTLTEQFNQLRTPLHQVTTTSCLEQLVRCTFARRPYA